VIGLHNSSPRTANNYGISKAAVDLVNSLQPFNAVTFVFGNVYAAQNFCKAPALVAMYEDDEAFHNAAADFMQAKVAAKGTLPVTVCEITYGTGLALNTFNPIGTTPEWLAVDSIVQEGLVKKAYPGAVVLAVQNGVIKYHKAFGRYEFDSTSQPVSLQSIYDLASVTKISATTLAVMKLYEKENWI
jgi:CubicO group peptidase (beta-lactamase class C family)